MPPPSVSPPIPVVEIAQDRMADGHHAWQYSDAEIDKLADPKIKAFFLVNPSNPASFAMHPKTQERLVALVKTRRPDLIILTDDVYGTFAEGFRSLAADLPRNTILVYLHIAGSELFPDQWIYMHAPHLLVGRITNFRNWVPQLYGASENTILAMEYWCYDDDSLWKEPDEQLVARARQEIASTRLIGGAAVLDGAVVRVRRCYPVYARGYQDHLAVLTDYLDQFSGLTPIGRYGAFKYNNQDHAMMTAMLTARNILAGERLYDVWEVNEDAQYQESGEADALISERLVPRPVAADEFDIDRGV